MSSIGSGPGQPNLLALLRALRLRAAAPDAAEAGAADTEAALRSAPIGSGGAGSRPAPGGSYGSDPGGDADPAGHDTLASGTSGGATPLPGRSAIPLPAGPAAGGDPAPAPDDVPDSGPAGALPPGHDTAPALPSGSSGGSRGPTGASGWAASGDPAGIGDPAGTGDVADADGELVKRSIDLPARPVRPDLPAGPLEAGRPAPARPIPMVGLFGLPLNGHTPPGTVPPGGRPPTGQPLTGQPPTGQPPTGQPATGQPSTGHPPADSPPAGMHVGGVNPAWRSGRPQPHGPLPGGHLPPPIGRPVPEAHPPAPGPAPVPGSVPPPGMHTGGPIDGTDPADDVALHDLQRLLATSLSMAGPVDEVADRLYEALTLARPHVLAVLPGTPETQRDQLAQALTWLVDNLDHPPVLAAGCGQLGGALREFGIAPQQLQLLGAALAEAMRAGMPAGGWRQEYDAAWRSTWRHVHEWLAHGAQAAAYQPVTWTAVVTGHELRRADLAVLRLRPYLPMPYRPGQYARVEVAELPGVWRPYSLAGVPRRVNEVELHVRAKGDFGVSGALVHRTAVGDRVRLKRAEGAMGLPPLAERDLLFIAGDTGVAPIKAMLAELAVTADPRSAVLFWGVRTLDELYDIDEIAALARACHRATVVPVVSEGPSGPYASGLVTDAVAAYGEWSSHEVFLAGPPPMLAATRAVLVQLGIAPERIHHDPTDAGPPAQSS